MRDEVEVAAVVGMIEVDRRRDEVAMDASAVATASTPPLAPRRWPMALFVELMASLRASRRSWS